MCKQTLVQVWLYSTLVVLKCSPIHKDCTEATSGKVWRHWCQLWSWEDGWHWHLTNRDHDISIYSMMCWVALISRTIKFKGESSQTERYKSVSHPNWLSPDSFSLKPLCAGSFTNLTRFRLTWEGSHNETFYLDQVSLWACLRGFYLHYSNWDGKTCSPCPCGWHGCLGRDLGLYERKRQSIYASVVFCYGLRMWRGYLFSVPAVLISPVPWNYGLYPESVSYNKSFS